MAPPPRPPDEDTARRRADSDPPSRWPPSRRGLAGPDKLPRPRGRNPPGGRRSPSCGWYHSARGPSPGGSFSALVAAATPLPATDEPMTDGSLTKAALIEEVAEVAGLTKRRAEIVVDTVFGSIVETLHRGEKVELRGFGSFRLRRREPHRGRNPRTGDRVQVPSKRVAYFTPGKELKELINRDPAQPDPLPMSG